MGGSPSTRALAGWTYWVTCGAVLAWALFLNFFRLGTPNVLGDETTYNRAARNYLIPNLPVRELDHSNFQHPPLAKWLFALAQWVAGHPVVTADRAVAASATVLTGVILVVWIGRAAGRWTGLLAGALAVLLPESVTGTTLRFGRYAMLDPVAELFVVVYLLLLWEWFTTSSRRRRWLLAGASGVAIGCATAAKENGFLAAMVPVALFLLTAWRQPEPPGRRLAQVGLAVLASLATFVAVYLPFGAPLQRIGYMISFQVLNSRQGHLIWFGGRLTAHPPWWANLWFAAHGMGAAVTIFLAGSAAVACLVRRDRLVGFCLAALAAPFVFHSFIAGVALPYYWTIWAPPVFALAALGVAELARLLRATPLPAVARAAAVALVLLIPVPACVSLTRGTAQITAYGPEVLGSVLARHHLTGPLLSSGIYSWEYWYYLPTTRVVYRPPPSLAGVDAVVIGAPQCRLMVDNATTRAIVAVNLAAGRLRRIHADSAMTVYQVTRPLIRPTAVQVAAQPPVNLAAGC